MFRRMLAAALAMVLVIALGCGISASHGGETGITREILGTEQLAESGPLSWTNQALVQAAGTKENCILPYFWTFGQAVCVGKTMALRTVVNDTGLTGGYQILEIYPGKKTLEEIRASHARPENSASFPCAGAVNVIDFTWPTKSFRQGEYTVYYKLVDKSGSRVADAVADVYLSETEIPLERIELYILDLDSTPEKLAAGYGKSFSVAVKYFPYHTTADRVYTLESTDPALFAYGATDHSGAYPGYYGIYTPQADRNAVLTAACGGKVDTISIYTRSAEVELTEVTAHKLDPAGMIVEQAATATKDGSGYAQCVYCGETFSTKIPRVFSDTSGKAYYSDAVDYCYANHIISGMTDSTFGPQVPLTRGMLVTMLHRFEQAPDGEEAPGFSDVDPFRYFYVPVAWASENGLVNGYPDGTFRPNDPITREQLVTILFRYVQWKGADSGQRDTLAGFLDRENVSSYAREAMQWSVANKVVSGMTADTLAPKGQATRAQAATVLYRIFAGLL